MTRPEAGRDNPILSWGLKPSLILALDLSLGLADQVTSLFCWLKRGDQGQEKPCEVVCMPGTPAAGNGQEAPFVFAWHCADMAQDGTLVALAVQGTQVPMLEWAQGSSVAGLTFLPRHRLVRQDGVLLSFCNRPGRGK